MLYILVRDLLCGCGNTWRDMEIQPGWDANPSQLTMYMLIQTTGILSLPIRRDVFGT